MFASKSTFCFSKCVVNQNCINSFIARNRWIADHPKLPYSRSRRPAAASGSVPNSSPLHPSLGNQSHFYTSCNHYGSRNLLKKFTNNAKKKSWYETPVRSSKEIYKPAGSGGALNLTARCKPKREDSMRIQILNSLLFKAISDLLHSSDVSSEICLLNVEISKVSLPLDFSCCRVYWKTSGTSEKDDLIQQGLNKCAPRIRYLLIADQILGSVPPVTFIKDKEYAAVSEIERLLKIADFGPGENTEELEQSLKDRGDSVRVAAASEQPTTSTAPGLFGIDHEALNRQILEYKRRTKEALVESSQFSLTEQQQELLAELRKQKIINKKKKKKSKRDIDIDITPQAYLLEKYSQEHSTEELEGPEYSTEDSEIKELISEEDQKNRFV